MAEILTKTRARNIFYGGSIFFVVVFVALTVDSHRYIVTTSTAGMPLSEAVVAGKHVWERNSCINCHSLHGEGAFVEAGDELGAQPRGQQAGQQHGHGGDGHHHAAFRISGPRNPGRGARRCRAPRCASGPARSAAR